MKALIIVLLLSGCVAGGHPVYYPNNYQNNFDRIQQMNHQNEMRRSMEMQNDMMRRQHINQQTQHYINQINRLGK